MDLRELIEVSRYYGTGNEFTIAGGGLLYHWVFRRRHGASEDGSGGSERAGKDV